MLEIGSLIDGKYKILNEVGHGGMSVVYLAMNERANKQWAIKEVRKDGVKDFEVVKQSLVAETNMLKFSQDSIAGVRSTVAEKCDKVGQTAMRCSWISALTEPANHIS